MPYFRKPTHMEHTRDVVNLAIIRDRKLLLGFKDKRGGMYIPLGGKRKEGESDRECLERELSEEVKGSIALLLGNATYIGNFQGKTPNTKSPVTAELYATTIGNLQLEPNSEILQLREFFYDDVLEEKHVSETTRKMAKVLKELNIIF